MDKGGFRKYLTKTGVKAPLTDIATIGECETLLDDWGKKGDFGKMDLNGLKRLMQQFVETGTNSRERLMALLRYSRFAKNVEIEIALLELLDGSEVLDKLSCEVRRTIGEERHTAAFKGIKLPQLGTFPVDKPKTTKAVMERLEDELGEDGCRSALLCGFHAGPYEEYLPEREAFLHSEGIDDFLRRRHKEYIAELEQHMKEGSLYWTQEIDQQVLDYVRRTPSCQVGVRRGSTICVTKVPYMAKRYFSETDQRMKRYYACHCSWVREGIRTGVEVSPNFCYCSAAFEKRPWDVIFRQPVKAEVVRSVLNGDLICEFAIHIPGEFMKSVGLTHKGEDG